MNENPTKDLDSTPDEELFSLFHRVCQDATDQQAQEELYKVLKTVPDAPQMYLRYMSMHADLYSSVRLVHLRSNLVEQITEERVVATELGTAELSAAESSPVESGAKFGAPWLGRFAAMFVMAASLLLALSWWPLGEPVSEDQDTVAYWPRAIAVCNRAIEVDWGKDEQLRPGGALTLNQDIRFRSGLVEIEFRQGALVVLEGPARLVVHDENRATLFEGSLAAVAPPWATGFRIDTPTLKVIDHGTKFAVSVNRRDGKADVKVVVEEGEVEVASQSDSGAGQRLFAGQGIHAEGESISQLDKQEDGQRLTDQLPHREEYYNGLVVADRWRDWVPGKPGLPNREGNWRHYTNERGSFGNPGTYKELLWNAEKEAYSPEGRIDWPKSSPFGFVKVHRDGGHPGKGRDQTDDAFDRYSITAFVVPEEGSYRLEAGWLERRHITRWDLDRVLDVAVHVNDGPILFQEYCNHESFMRFRGELGQLKAGDVIYVGVGPNGVDHSDRFRWGFVIVRDQKLLPKS